MAKTSSREWNCEIITHIEDVNMFNRNIDIFGIINKFSKQKLNKNNIIDILIAIVAVLVRKRHIAIPEVEIIENVDKKDYDKIFNNLKKCDFICDKNLFLFYLMQEEYEFFIKLIKIIKGDNKIDNLDIIKTTKGVYGEYISIK